MGDILIHEGKVVRGDVRYPLVGDEQRLECD